jgi:hypothetical protein
MGTKDGSIMATIITNHMPRNDAAAMSQVCPGRGSHIIDSADPPHHAISPSAGMNACQASVAVALAAKSSAATPKKTLRERATLVTPAVVSMLIMGRLAWFIQLSVRPAGWWMLV